MAFSELLKCLLAERNLTPSQFSRAIDISRTTVGGWLKAKRLPDFITIKKLADFFEISTDELLDMQEYGSAPKESDLILSDPAEKNLMIKYRSLTNSQKLTLLQTIEKFR